MTSQAGARAEALQRQRARRRSPRGRSPGPGLVRRGATSSGLFFGALFLAAACAPAAAQSPGPGPLPSGAGAEGRESPEQPSGPGRLDRVLRAFGLKPSPSEAGLKAYEAGDYDRALRRFAEAELEAAQSQSLAYNMGNVRYRRKEYGEAIRLYTKALAGKDASVAAKAHYNLGNAHFRRGESGAEAGGGGLQEYRTAMAHYKKSLEIDPGNRDAKRNIEVVQARIKELLERQEHQEGPQGGKPPPEPSERAKRVLARAVQLVAQRRYEEAKRLLEAIIREDATAESYQAHVGRIDDVLRILEGGMPDPPGGNDPRARQEGLGVI